jgi:hypothetical protein
MTIDIGAAVELDLTGKHDDDKKSVFMPPRPVRKTIGNALTTPASNVLNPTFLAIPQYPANGRVWEIIQAGFFGADAHTDIGPSSQIVSDSVAITAGVGTYTATLPAGSTITAIAPITTVGAGSTATTITVSGVQGGTITYQYISPATGEPGPQSLPLPPGGLPAASPSSVPTVTFNGVADTGAGEMTVIGTQQTQANVIADLFVAQSTDVNYVDLSAAVLSNQNVASINNLGHKKIWVHPQEVVYALFYGPPPVSQQLAVVITVDEWALADIEAMEIR